MMLTLKRVYFICHGIQERIPLLLLQLIICTFSPLYDNFYLYFCFFFFSHTNNNEFQLISYSYSFFYHFLTSFYFGTFSDHFHLCIHIKIVFFAFLHSSCIVVHIYLQFKLTLFVILLSKSSRTFIIARDDRPYDHMCLFNSSASINVYI